MDIYVNQYDISTLNRKVFCLKENKMEPIVWLLFFRIIFFVTLLVLII